MLNTNFSMYGGFFGGKKLKHNKNKIKSPILFAIQGEGNTNIKQLYICGFYFKVTTHFFITFNMKLWIHARQYIIGLTHR